MKKLMGIACAALVVLTVGLTAGPANAEPLSATSSTTSAAVSAAPQAAPDSLPTTVYLPMTGNYLYNCVLQNGWSYMMAPGEALTNCHGSYLQKYLDGRMLSSVNLVNHITPDNGPLLSVGCMLTIAGAASLVFFPEFGSLVWYWNVVIAGTSTAVSCTSF